MNMNAIIASLVIKGIYTTEEGEKMSEYLNNKPQSPYLSDAIEQVKEFIKGDSPAAKKVTAAAKKVAADTAEQKVADEVGQIDQAVKNQADKPEK